jgi:starch synthase (maltosyl-transferring)
VLYWAEQGVRIFRVDNPHTKPLPFWAWLIPSVREKHPDVVFLSEAFTRPKLMKALAKLGFSQSYTYFTWRHSKAELTEYLEEITRPPVSDYFRGNLWPNTPDILPQGLQHGGPPAFRLRLALAATLSSSYGIYQGYELCEGRAVSGTEEYLDSEKYELKAWDLDRPGNIRPFVQALNRIRREHPAFSRYGNLRFCPTTNERVIAYARWTDDHKDQVLVTVSLDPYQPQEAVVTLPLDSFGVTTEEEYEVLELLSVGRSLWQGEHAHVALTPEAPAAIWAVSPWRRTETSFDYF